MAELTTEVTDPDVDALLSALQREDGIVVAFSGGADSGFLLAAAVRALGPERVLAVTARSPSLPAAELEPAAAFADELGVSHWVVDTHEMEREGYRANEGDRCYFCKSELTEVAAPIAAERGWALATGTNADDRVAGFRPGIRAAAERGAITPLADAGLTKEQVRHTSRLWGLPTWDKPAAACLSSRIAYGIQISPARLARVERAEVAVRDALSRQGVDVAHVDLRVRDLGSGRARLELDAGTRAIALDEQTLRAAVLDAGFDEVESRDFRSGSMNDALKRTPPTSGVDDAQPRGVAPLPTDPQTEV